jgi:hypothetical protein
LGRRQSTCTGDCLSEKVEGATAMLPSGSNQSK